MTFLNDWYYSITYRARGARSQGFGYTVTQWRLHERMFVQSETSFSRNSQRTASWRTFDRSWITWIECSNGDSLVPRNRLLLSMLSLGRGEIPRSIHNPSSPFLADNWKLCSRGILIRIRPRGNVLRDLLTLRR